MSFSNPTVAVNGTSYRWPDRPLVVVVIDGGDPAYLEAYFDDRSIPNLARFAQRGFATVAEGTVPSFTCPNNMSIVTGTPASVHGISGNFYLDTATGAEVPMTGPELLRADTILAGFAAAGARVAAVTAKDKLRRQLGKGLDVSSGNVCFSAECAASTTAAEHGLDRATDVVGQPQPGMYSSELSLFVLDAGIRLLERGHRDLLFLSLTDWVQHKYAPHEDEARHFYRAIDRRLGRLEELGATLAVTADHGMNDKSMPDGRPNVIWLQDVLDDAFGRDETRVICPITDAFVAHHGALGGFVRVWCRADTTPRQVIAVLHGIAGIDRVLDKAAACAAFDLPPDREGDVVVVAAANTCIGASQREHDLSGLAGHRLRTHGGSSESKVPFILSRPLNAAYRRRVAWAVPKSWQLFDFALNGVAE